MLRFSALFAMGESERAGRGQRLFAAVSLERSHPYLDKARGWKRPEKTAFQGESSQKLALFSQNCSWKQEEETGQAAF